MSTLFSRARHTARLRFALALCIAALAGCASPTYRRMPLESAVPALAKAAQAYYDARDDLLLAPTVERNGDAHDHPLRVAIHRVGPPPAQSGHRVIVFLHGVLSDSRAWRHVAGLLLHERRLWLVDFPGLGQSDRAHPFDFPPSAFSPTWLAERTTQALERAVEAETASNPDAPLSITLVGHSLGGAVALHMLSDPHIRTAHADLIRRIDGAVLIAPLDANLPIVNPATRQAARVSGLEVLLASLTGTARERIARGVAQNAADPNHAVREEVDAKCDILTDEATRAAAQAMLLRAVPNKHDRPDWPAIEAVTTMYGRVELPVLLLWGQRDESLPVAMGYKLASQLPHAELRIFPTAKHSPQLDFPDVVAQLIQDFIASGGARLPDHAKTHRAPRLAQPSFIDGLSPTPSTPGKRREGAPRDPPRR